MCVFCCFRNVYVNNFRFCTFYSTIFYSPLLDRCQCMPCNTQQQAKRSNRSSLYNVLDSCLNITRSSTVCLFRLIFQIFFHVSTVHLMWPMQLNTPHISGVECTLLNLVKLTFWFFYQQNRNTTISMVPWINLR